MNGKDKEWLQNRFDMLNNKMDRHSERLACLETKWKMAEKFVGIFSATIALITTIVVRIFWR